LPWILCPAVFAVTQKAFIVFTSNVFAILGLRSMYFLLAGALGYFRLPENRPGARARFSSAVKCCSTRTDHPPQWFQIEISTTVSLLVVAAILLIAIALSVTAARREEKSRMDADGQR
jgi:tellurite resistance protein TerC